MRLFANSGEDFSTVHPHSHVEVFPPNHKGSESSTRTCCTSVRSWSGGLDSEKTFKYLPLLKYDSNLSNAAFEEGIRVAGLARASSGAFGTWGFSLPCQCVSASSEDLACLVLLRSPRVGGFNSTTTDRHVGNPRDALAWRAT